MTEGPPQITYEDGAVFARICPKCGRFVKADAEIQFRESESLADGPTATCKRCGRVSMPFEGWY